MTQEQPIHQVQCQDCKRWPINGWAYRCGQCPASLCGACIIHTQHNADHAFVLLKRPLDSHYAQREQLLAVTPYTWVDPNKPSPLPKPVPFANSPAFKPPSFTFGSTSDAPTLEHKKGPLFERAAELAFPPDTAPNFAPSQQEQMTIEADGKRGEKSSGFMSGGGQPFTVDKPYSFGSGR